MRIPWVRYELHRVRDWKGRLIEVRPWIIDDDHPGYEVLQPVGRFSKNFWWGDFGSPSVELALSILADFLEVPAEEASKVSSVPMKLHRAFLEDYIAPVHPNTNTLILDGRTIESFIEAEGYNPQTRLTDPSQIPDGMTEREAARFFSTHTMTKECLDKAEVIDPKTKAMLERELPRKKKEE